MDVIIIWRAELSLQGPLHNEIWHAAQRYISIKLYELFKPCHRYSVFLRHGKDRYSEQKTRYIVLKIYEVHILVTST